MMGAILARAFRPALTVGPRRCSPSGCRAPEDVEGIAVALSFIAARCFTWRLVAIVPAGAVCRQCCPSLARFATAATSSGLRMAILPDIALGERRLLGSGILGLPLQGERSVRRVA